MNNILHSLFAALAFGFALSGFAAVPTSAYLHASRAATVSVDDGRSTSSYELSTLSEGTSGSWYGEARIFIKDKLRLTSAQTGYLTSWQTYATEPTGLSAPGPDDMTKILSATNLLTLTTEVISNLYSRYNTTATDLYVKFTPITYRLDYKLGGGAFPTESSHPSTATYDQPFTVSAPVRDFCTFNGWQVGDKTYFSGATGDVEFKNLTTTNGATVGITAVWAVNKYPLQLSFGEGVAKIHYRPSAAGAWQETTTSLSVDVGYGETWSAWAEPAYGYEGTGSGWSQNSPTSGKMTEAGDTFSPVATRKRFTVTAKASPSDAGTVTGTGTFEYGAQTALTASPASGYAFSRWSDGSTENPHDITVVSATNITAYFTTRNYDLQLVVGEGVARIFYRLQQGDVWQPAVETDISTTVPVAYGTRYKVWAETSVGWELTGSGSSEGSAIVRTMDAAGYVFEPKPTKIQYEVQVNSNPSEGGTTKVNGTGKFDLGETATVEANASTGYRFVRWDATKPRRADVSRNPLYSFTVSGNVSLEAVFEKESYTVAFVYRLENGAEYRDEQTVAYNDSAVEPPAEKRNNWPGHTFVQWDSSDWKSVKGNCVITAQYADGQYTVRFEACGGTGSMSDQTFTYGTEQALAKCNFKRTGYTFAGWTKDAGSDRVDFEDQQRVRDLTTAASLTLYAVWKPITYTIRFTRGKAAKGEPFDRCVTYDEPYVLDTCPYESTTAFNGWYDTSSHLTYQAGESVVRLASTEGAVVTLEAQYGTGSQVKFHADYIEQYETQSFRDGVEEALRANSFTRTGYTFIGWAKTSGDAESLRVDYQDQALVSDPADTGETLDLYAVWKPNTYQVVFDGNNHDDFQMLKNERVQKYEWDKTEIADPNVKKGVGFLGFDFDPEITTPRFKASEENNKIVVVLKNLTAIPSDHIRLYAIWETKDKNAQNVPTVKSALKRTFSAPLLAASSTPVLTSSAQSEWENVGWTALGDGVYTNGAAVATLSRSITTNGTLTFEWMPSAVGDKIDDPYEEEPVDQSTRRSGANISIECGGKSVGALKGSETACDLKWNSGKFVIDHVTAESVLQMTSQAAGNFESGIYPVMIRNLQWEEVKESFFTNNVQVTFEIDPAKGAYTGGGALTQEVAVVTNAAGAVIQPGAVTDVPTVVGKSVSGGVGNWQFMGWDMGGQRYSADEVKGLKISADTVFTAAFETDTFEKKVDVTFTLTNVLQHVSGDLKQSASVYTNASGEVVQAGTATLPMVRPTAGYALKGWRVDAVSCGVSVDDENFLIDAAGRRVDAGTVTNITEDLPVTAVATTLVYSITYEGLGEATHSNTNRYTVEDAVVFTDPSDRKDWTFTGWTTNGVAVTGIAKGTTGDQTVTATWEEKPDPGSSVGPKEVSVRFVIDLGRGCRIGGGALQDTVLVQTNGYGEVKTFGTTLSPTVVGTNGWDFAGWYDAAGKTNILADALVNYPVKDDVTTFAAAFTPHAYGIRYANTREHNNPLNARTFVSTSGTIVTNGVDCGAAMAYGRLMKFDTETDDAFVGWMPSELLAGVYQRVDPATCTYIYTNVVTQAQWKDMIPPATTDYTVTFLSGEDYSVTDIVTVAEGKGVTNAPSAAERLGYVFTGWDKSLDNVRGDFTTKAQYTLVRYPITYLNLKGETHENPSEYDITMVGMKLGSPSCGNPDLMWLGWSPTNCLPRDSVGALAYSGTWAYRLTFSEDAERRVTITGGAKPDCFVAEGTGVTNTPAVEVQAGYSFAGWKNAKGAIIPAGLVSNVTEAATYTAVATANVYRIVYEGLEGAKNNANNPATYTVEDAVVFLPPSDRPGYRFTGWTPSGIAVGTMGEVTVIAGWSEAPTYRVEVKAEGEGGVALYDAAGREVANPGCYVEGTALVAEATASNGWLFAGWTVDATSSSRLKEEESSSSRSGKDSASPLGPLYAFVVSNDVSLIAVFTQRVYTVTVDGKVTGVRYGETASYSTPASVTNGMTNVVCTGWVGTGDVPASGTSNGVSFVVTQESSLDWRYATNYWVSVGGAAIGVRAIVGVGAAATRDTSVALYDAAGAEVDTVGWFGAGTNLVAEATASNGWAFAGWTVDATSSSRLKEDVSNSIRRGEDAASTMAFTVTSPVVLMAVFTQKVYVVSFELDENLERTGGGELVQTVAYGEAATLPTVEGIGYYALEGWYDADGRRVNEESLRFITASAVYYARSVEAEPYIAADVAAEYETKETIEPIVVRCVHEEDATLKVTGLPTGLYFTTKEKKYTVTVGGRRETLTAPANSIYGTPSKSGLWTSLATASVSVKSGRKTVTTVVATTNLAFVIRSGGETVVRTEVSLVEDVSETSVRIRDVTSATDGATVVVVPGKTTGQGVYAVGKKVTLKATANTGYVFSGWYGAGVSEANSLPITHLLLSDDDVVSTLLSRAASLAIVVPENDVTYEARFITAEDDAASIRASANGMALFSDEEITPAGTPLPLDVATNVSVGVYMAWPVAYGADSAATVAVSGLPSGLKFTAKPITQTVTVGGVRTVVTNVPANTIYGTPTAASKTDRWGEVVPSEVKVTVTTAGKAKAVGVVELTVEALPEAFVGTYVGGSTNEPTGSASVTLAKTGKVSGKWISEGKTWTITAASLNGYDREAATLSAEVTLKDGKLVETEELVFGINDLGYGTVVSDLFSATYVPWKTDAELKELAKELKGEKFTVASDDGVTLAGTVGASGVVSVKGSFDVGEKALYTATVSSTLVPVDDEHTAFELFVYYPPNVRKKFDGYATTLLLGFRDGILTDSKKEIR